MAGTLTYRAPASLVRGAARAVCFRKNGHVSSTANLGLEGVVAFETEIAEPDKEGSALRYRGVDIEELAGNVPFEQVWGLVVNESLAAGTAAAGPRRRARLAHAATRGSTCRRRCRRSRRSGA